MIVRDKISVTLKHEHGKRFCDQCMRDRLETVLLSQVNQASKDLVRKYRGVPNGFAREKSACDLCGQARIVTRSD